MDFEKFYDRQTDYEAFRHNPAKRDEYIIIVDWKARQLEKLVPKSMQFNNILEIGCALGILLNNLAGRLAITERTGLEISSENLKIARELYPENLYFQGTIEDFKGLITQNFKFSKFSLVLLSDIVEHIPDDVRFMQEVKGISSYVLINLPLEKCFKNRNRKYGENDPSGHLRCYDKKMAHELIVKAEFEVVSSFVVNASSDSKFLALYRNNRNKRLKTKPLLLTLFWKVFYLIEDILKLSHKGLSEKIFGANYFALLKSIERESEEMN